jgi:hypothetical protein
VLSVRHADPHRIVIGAVTSAAAAQKQKSWADVSSSMYVAKKPRGALKKEKEKEKEKEVGGI